MLQYNELRKYVSALTSETGEGLGPTKPPQGLLKKTKKFLLKNHLMRRKYTVLSSYEEAKMGLSHMLTL